MSAYMPEQPFFELSTDKYVSCFGASSPRLAQYYSFVVSANNEKGIIAVPDGTIDILFHCSSSNPKALICGSVKKGKPLSFKKGALYFGARFFPGAAKQLLKCPIDKFTDKEVRLDDVLISSKGLAESICAAKSFDERVKLFEQYHNPHNKKITPVPPFVSYLLGKINSSAGEVRIQDLAEETGYSTRHINNLFKKHVGVSPKLFLRIIRFQRCFELLRHQKTPAFASLALELGYYDQAHFTNEFKEFALCTPSQVFGAGLN